MKYIKWLTIWMQNTIQYTTKPKTYERYNELIIGHIKTKLGDYELNELTPLILQNFITELLQSGNLLTGKGLSSNTVNIIITILQNSLKSAFFCKELNEYVADKIQRPKIKEKEIACFSITEQRKIEKAVLTSNQDKLFGILICLYTGLRIGELLALEWNDIDLLKGTLIVSKTCYYGKGMTNKFQRRISLPKTKSSNRIIPIPQVLLPMLKRIKSRSLSIYVIANKEKPISIRSYQRSFSLLLKNIGLNHRGFHAIRHTFATRAIEKGIDVKTLSEILGHKNASITLNRYVHSLLEHKRKMMNKLSDLLE